METTLKTLIVFDSKWGTTRTCATMLAQRLRTRTDILDLATMKKPNSLQQYDAVVIGTPMYMGKPMQRVVQFCKAYERELMGKILAIFTCGIGTAEEDHAYLSKHLPSSLTDHAVALRHFGGELLLDKMNPLERMAMGAYVREHGPVKGIDENQIDEFSELVNRMRTAS